MTMMFLLLFSELARRNSFSVSHTTPLHTLACSAFLPGWHKQAKLYSHCRRRRAVTKPTAGLGRDYCYLGPWRYETPQSPAGKGTGGRVGNKTTTATSRQIGGRSTLPTCLESTGPSHRRRGLLADHPTIDSVLAGALRPPKHQNKEERKERAQPDPFRCLAAHARDNHTPSQLESATLHHTSL